MVKRFLKPNGYEKSASTEAIPFPCSTIGCLQSWESLLNSIVVIINSAAKITIIQQKVKY